jgi:hypothetical protein
MKVHDIFNKVKELEIRKNVSANALASAIAFGSPQSVIKSFEKDYKRNRKQYFDYIEQHVEIIKT